MGPKLVMPLVALFAVVPAFGADSLSDRLDAIVTAQAQKHQVAGFSVAVSWHATTVLDKGYGMANVETGNAASENTLFSIGSNTKQFTAAAILQLAEQGALSLDDDIHNIVPEYPAHQPPETVRSLLSHTSGIPDYFPTDEADDALIFKPISEAGMIARFAAAPLDFVPGTNFAYSNSNFYLLGLAIERITGLNYNDYLRQHLFQPLGLDIVECGTAAVGSRMAQGYLPDSTGKLVATGDMDMSWAFAAGNLCATPLAIVKWNSALHRGSVLSPWAYSVMTTAAVMSDGTPTTYGAGLFVDEVEGHRHFEHGGDTLTFSSQEAYYPDEDLSIAILTNTESAFDRYGLERELAREVLGLPTPVTPTAALPNDLGDKVAGSYNIPGRVVFGPNPSTIAVANDLATLSVGGVNAPLRYEGDGRFGIGSPDKDVSVLFPISDGPEPFFSIFIHELLIARGMRAAPQQQAGPRLGATSLRRPLNEYGI